MEIDIHGTVQEAVLAGLITAGAEDTTANRITVLVGIHNELADSAPINPIRNAFLVDIENEVGRLQGLGD